LALFTYQTVDANGSKINGTIDAISEAMALSALTNKGYVVLSLQEVKQKKIGPIFSIRLLDVMTFSRQLATMIESGVNLAMALDVLSAQDVFTPKFRSIIAKVLAEIEAGMTFGEALRAERVFDEVFINLVEAGETSGTLAETLEKVAQFYESQKRLKDEIRSAMAYPIFVLIFALLMIGGIVMIILPQLISGFGRQPEGIMAALMNLNVFVTNYWPILIPIVIGIIAGLFFYLKTRNGKQVTSFLLGNIPIIKTIRLNSCLERFCRTLSVMTATGVDIIKGLELSSKAAGDIRFERVTNEMAESIKQGTSLETAFDEAEIFPGIVVAMVGTGERTGKLDAVLEKVGIFFEEKVRASVKQLVSLIEPTLIVFVGLFIAFIAYTMYTSMYSGMEGVAGGF